MSIARPRRFTSSYGYNEQRLVYQSSYSLLPSGGTVTNQENFLRQYAYRKLPVSQPIVLGWRSPTEWSMTSHRVSYTPHSYLTKYYGRTYNVTGDGPHTNGMGRPARPYDISSGFPNLSIGLSTSSYTKALNNIKNQKIDLGVMFGEANETLRLLTNSIVRLSKFARQVKKGNWAQAGRDLGFKGWKTAPNSWLEYQYGWMPLLNDIYGLQEQLKTPFVSEGFLIKATGVSQEEKSPRDAVQSIAKTTYVSGFYRHISKSVLYMKVTDSRLLAMSQLGLANPASLAWELTTLSFVIDWFIPIGSFLQSFTAALGTAFVGGYEDRIVTYDINVKGYWGSFIEGDKANYASQLLAFKRELLFSAVPPNLFSLGSGLSNLPRALSAASLLATRR